MITTDGHDTKDHRSSPKFGGWHKPIPDGVRGLGAEMTGYLHDLHLDGLADDSDSQPDWGVGWARFGRRVLHWDSSGLTWHSTFDNETEATVWCDASRYEDDDE